MDGGILLVNMPFSGAGRPQIALGLLQAAVRAHGIPCDTAYLNLVLAERLGVRVYEWIGAELNNMNFAGEWVFAHPFFGETVLDGQGYLRHLRHTAQVDEAIIQLILRIREQIPDYLDHCLKLVDWSRYSIIGFTSSFEQNMASVSLAYAIKRRHPHKIIVFGGSNCGHPMGEALMRCFPFIDYVFTGEADASFPTFVQRLENSEQFVDIKGIVFRDGKLVRSTGLADSISNMDSLPFPDYDDYFSQLASMRSSSDLTPLLPFETARGCWWGARHHCTFCGLNALSMNFRAKSKDRAIEEILYLTARHGIRRLAAVDNIIDMNYFREMLPELKARNLDLTIFYETKSNLTKEQVQLLALAGVKLIQPGIESFSLRLLKMMRKGVSPLQNVQLLKWCKQYGVQPIWNLLYRIPGEKAEDYELMLPLLESITHLTPPSTNGTIRLDRYSPYFQSPESFGLVNARPAEAYRYIYPFSSSELRDLAYHYDFSFVEDLNPNQYLGPIIRQLELWQQARAGGAELYAYAVSDDELVIDDSRPNASSSRITLSGWRRDLYDYCDRIRSTRMITDLIERDHPSVTRVELNEYLQRLVRMKLMAHDQDQFLSLAVDRNQDSSSSCV